MTRARILPGYDAWYRAYAQNGCSLIEDGEIVDVIDFDGKWYTIEGILVT